MAELDSIAVPIPFLGQNRIGDGNKDQHHKDGTEHIAEQLDAGRQFAAQILGNLRGSGGCTGRSPIGGIRLCSTGFFGGSGSF